MSDAHLPIDTSVKLPSSVTAAVAAADAIHKAAYATPEPQPAPAPEPQPAPAPEPVTAPVTVQEQTPPQPPPEPPKVPAQVPDVTLEQMHHRYLSMKGRYDQSQQTIGQMQEQMSQMGDELMRVTTALEQRQQRPVIQDEPPPAHVRLTEKDIQTYGPELVDLIQRAALDVVTPELGKTVQAVKQTQARVAQTSAQALYSTLDQQVPDWRSVNIDPAFKAWCNLPDIYSGRLRAALLKDAFQAANAPRVVAFFKGFKAEQQVTGQVPVPVQGQQQETVPRQAAVALETLVAPGTAKPAPGGTPVDAANKPVFTNNDIKNFYANVRRGYYNGREADKQRDEAALFLAQREGRIRG